MHEMSIVVQLTRTLEDIMKEQNINKIKSVTIQMGEVSGVIPMFFTECWDLYKSSVKGLENTEVIIEKLPAVTFCEDCEKTYSTLKYGKTCPFCKSGNTYLLKGMECNIKEIEAEVEEDYYI